MREAGGFKLGGPIGVEQELRDKTTAKDRGGTLGPFSATALNLPETVSVVAVLLGGRSSDNVHNEHATGGQYVH